MRILFVCLGNICRSPLAEGILRRQAEEAKFKIHVDSAGTGNWHVGLSADPRSIRVGVARGCRMDMRARQVRPRDFVEFDLILAMDQDNIRDLQNWSGSKPEKIRLVRSFDPNAKTAEVPDPYYGEAEDFEEVAEMLEVACQGIIDAIRNRFL